MNAGGNDQITAIRPYVKHFQLLWAICIAKKKKILIVFMLSWKYVPVCYAST